MDNSQSKAAVATFNAFDKHPQFEINAEMHVLPSPEFELSLADTNTAQF